MDNLRLTIGDITTARVDAIVNAANEKMLGGGGVDSAISCGVFGYPLQEAARVALAACSDEEFAALDICFCLFGEETFAAWQQAHDHR